jgi:UDP-glucuronate 4-epimerase
VLVGSTCLSEKVKGSRKMKTVVVTGAAGFIGSHIAEALLRRGDAVVGIDNVNDYYPISLKRNNLDLLRSFERFSFIEGDICDPSVLRGAVKGHDISHVAHLAARAGVRPSIQDPGLYQRVNIEGTLQILELCVQLGVRNAVITSSSSVYGNSESIPFREDDSATDQPISPYAATKKATELLSYTYHSLHGLNVNIVRPFTVYGPRGRPDMAPWLFLTAALQGEKIKKFGDGSSRRDYTFITDFVAGFVQAIDREFGYEIFNLGNSATVSLNEAIDTIEKVTGRQMLIEQYPMQPGDVLVTNADISKAQAMLDYAPTTSFCDGMDAFHQWYVANEI